MALVNINSAQRRIFDQMKKTPEGHGVEILSYKRNRRISLIRAGGDSVVVRECGYRDNELTVTLSDLPNVLRSMMKYEFPRSRKVRVYRLGGDEAAGREMKKL